ncbi:Peptidyl-prolyl cis-trans isomerase cyp10 [Toensbergia leucococca]|nr:Peptidyl-prolyl cis-trans isomerase cyp10 [Toensbergia leucococca]
MSVTLHTDLGDLKIEVFCESVPKTAQNFLALCASGYYDSSPFHRSLPTFMIQTGSPSHLSPKVSNSIWETDFEDEIRPSLRHNARGILSMANKGPNTNGSQFFICYAPAPHLDGKNSVFGRLIGGEEILGRLEELEVDKKGRPKERVEIKSVTMHANPLAG